MRKILSVMALGASLIAAGPATAQSWGVYVGTGGGYPRYDRAYGDDDRLARVICSGQRAHQLEDRLRHEVDENEIDDDDADRIHTAIDRLEDRQHHECREGDRRAIAAIAYRYDRIGQWIESEAHRGW
jgi:hypothetical protein